MAGFRGIFGIQRRWLSPGQPWAIIFLLGRFAVLVSISGEFETGKAVKYVGVFDLTKDLSDMFDVMIELQGEFVSVINLGGEF